MTSNPIDEVKEIWKPLPDDSGYEVSNKGNVRTKKPRNRNDRSGVYREIKLHKAGRNGMYRSFCAYSNGKKKTKLVHRAVLEAFVGACPEGMEACHNDGNSLNNAVENLRWDTRSNNTLDQIKHGVHIWVQYPEKIYGRKLSEQDVSEIKALLSSGVSQTKIAKKYNIAQPHVCDINTGKVHGHVKCN